MTAFDLRRAATTSCAAAPVRYRRAPSFAKLPWMGITEDRLDNLVAEGQPANRLIASAIFCERCGYQLRMLPYVGRCPECGNEYHARGINTRGVFVPQTAEFPGSTILAALASIALVLWLTAGLLQEFDLWALLFALLFGFLGVVFSGQAWRGLCRFVQGQKLSAEIDAEKE